MQVTRPKKRVSAKLQESVAFDAPTGATGSLGGTAVGWAESHACRGQWIYQSGNEAVQAARLAGRSVYKIRVRSCDATRALTTAHRMRDTRRGTAWNIREVDAITDRAWVYLTVEGEVVG